ncbi:carboxylesterase/lipase family protein [Sphingopyxis sp. 113P3]|uniref:carboxylesterase/lipase family protein n=1 Tax=Sphingopyxis sp. (strain 113P3) TaxID=292913 RepID=UPI0006AD0E48|nr:carboxylesterase family protein [Sphingopyxis sp. 113P3]ALC14008.1 carboxylesterase [Sphingopyxis sp. 113P3]
MSAAEGVSRRALLGSAAGLLIAAASQTARAGSGPDVVSAPDGAYRSLGTGEKGARLCFYPGIRYARAGRFRAPVPVLRAEQHGGGFGPACPQRGNRYQPQSEDCLFLNVWTPSMRADAKRPVMVYFHGGAYSAGSVTDPINDGARLAARGEVVVVTVNHRLNALGYLYLARLDSRFPDSGNAGQLDLIVALQWIQRNIAAFGGDPANVTLFGQSGGGAKIATLMAMPEAKGLFHKAITMSGQQVTASGPLNATRRAKAFLGELGPNVDPVTAPVEQLVAALAATDPILGGGVYMGPVLDMVHLKRHPFWPDAAPQSLGIPMMLGNAVMETRAFYAPDSKPLAGLDFGNLAARIAPEMRVDIHPEWVVEQFRARYPDAPPLELFHRIVTAARSWRGQVEEAEARARAGAPAFVYQLDFEAAKHTDDIGLSFGTIPHPTPGQQAMSDIVMEAFVRFARTGDPGWPAYDLPKRQTMIFDAQSRLESDPRRFERELFARVPYVQPGT